DHAAVREVDDAQHAVDQAEAVRHRGVQAGQQDRVDDQLEEPAHLAQAGFGATPCPVAASGGAMIGAVPSGRFCCATKGACACCPNSAGNVSSPPGSSEGTLSAASLARTGSRSSDPACVMATKSARAVS